MDTTTTGLETTTEVVATEEEATAEDTIDEVIENFTLDDLMAYSEEKDPLFTDDAQHKGMAPLHEWIHNVPEPVRKHLANIRADYTRKSQDLAVARKEVEAAQEAVRQQNDNILNNATAKITADVDETAEYDLFDPEGMKSEIQRQAKLMLRDMLQPAQEELKIQQRRLELDRFKGENPEMTDPEYRSSIVELLKTRPELSMEDAFYITKAKIGSTRLQQDKDDLNARKARQREVVRKSSTGTKSQPKGTPKFKNALEAFKFHKSQQTK